MNDFVFALTLTPGSGKKFRQRIYFITRTIRNENKNKKKAEEREICICFN